MLFTHPPWERAAGMGSGPLLGPALYAADFNITLWSLCQEESLSTPVSPSSPYLNLQVVLGTCSPSFLPKSDLKWTLNAKPLGTILTLPCASISVAPWPLSTPISVPP